MAWLVDPLYLKSLTSEYALVYVPLKTDSSSLGVAYCVLDLLVRGIKCICMALYTLQNVPTSYKLT